MVRRAVTSLLLPACTGSVAVAHRDGERTRVANPGCRTGPLSRDPLITEENARAVFLFPYGTVASCRILGGEVNPVSTVQVSTDLLLQTRRGSVAVRVEYRGLDAGWQWTAVATELPADQAAHLLSDPEERRLRAAIAERGGVLAEDWVLHYGDR